MTIRALTAATDLATAQAALRREFYEGAALLTRTIGTPGGSTTGEIAWHVGVRIWGYIDDAESAYGPDGADGHFWNSFGLDDPSQGKRSLAVTVQVNPPLQGTNGRVAGIFGRDSDGPIVLLHRGIIGGGKAGVGKDLFQRQFQGKWEFVDDGDGFVDCAVVATLGASNLVPELRRFVEDVARMKASVRQR